MIEGFQKAIAERDFKKWLQMIANCKKQLQTLTAQSNCKSLLRVIVKSDCKWLQKVIANNCKKQLQILAVQSNF